MQDPKQREADRWSLAWRLGKIALALTLVGLVVSRTSVEDVIAIARSVDYLWLVGYVAVTYLALALYAARYRILIERRVSFRQAFGLVLMQSAIGNLVANPAGMASYVTVLRTRYHVNVAQSVASLVVSRIADLALICAGLALSAALVWERIAPIQIPVVVIIMAILGGCLLIALALTLRQSFLALVRRILAALRLGETALGRGVLGVLEPFASQDLRSLTPWVLPVALSSFGVLLCSVISSLCAVQMFHIPVGLREILFLVVMVQLISIIPIQVFGGLGVSEVTTMYLYGLFGVTAEVIAPILVGARVLFYLTNLSYVLWIAIDTLLERRTQGAARARP